MSVKHMLIDMPVGYNKSMKEKKLYNNHVPEFPQVVYLIHVYSYFVAVSKVYFVIYVMIIPATYKMPKALFSKV